MYATRACSLNVFLCAHLAVCENKSNSVMSVAWYSTATFMLWWCSFSQNEHFFCQCLSSIQDILESWCCCCCCLTIRDFTKVLTRILVEPPLWEDNITFFALVWKVYWYTQMSDVFCREDLGQCFLIVSLSSTHWALLRKSVTVSSYDGVNECKRTY